MYSTLAAPGLEWFSAQQPAATFRDRPANRHGPVRMP